MHSSSVSRAHRSSHLPVWRSLAGWWLLPGLLALAVPRASLAADPTSAPAKEDAASDKSAVVQRVLRAALKEAGGIKDPEGQANALSTLASTLAESGTIPAALETAAGIKDVSIRIGALVSVASTAVKTGKTDVARDVLTRARAAAGTIRNAEERSTELAIVATAQIEAGDKAGARETAAAISPGPEQINALAQAGDFAAARRAAGALKDVEARISLLGNLVREQAQAGDIAGARETLTDIKPPERRPEGMAEIGAAQMKAGDAEGARATFAQARKLSADVADPGERTSALMTVAVAQANAGDLPGAEETAGTAAPGDSRCEVLTAVARALLGIDEPGD